MGKMNNALQISAWTTGAGIAIGTNVDFGGIWLGTANTTVTLLHGAAGTASFLVISGANNVFASNQVIASSGPLNGTSSGGSFAVLYRQRVS